MPRESEHPNSAKQLINWSVRYLILIVFVGAGVADLFFIHNDLPYRHFSKPLIMISLIAYFLYRWDALEENTPKRVFLIGLGAALLGDVFLLSDKYFTLGIISFLVMQARYLECFIKDGKTNKKALVVMVVLVPIALYLISLMWTSLGKFKIPVVVYMVALVLTAISAAARSNEIKGYHFVALGALLFVCSDTVIALHKFTPDIRLGNLTVMTTYIIAQYLIVEGYIMGHLRKEHSV